MNLIKSKNLIKFKGKKPNKEDLKKLGIKKTNKKTKYEEDIFKIDWNEAKKYDNHKTFKKYRESIKRIQKGYNIGNKNKILGYF